jgi:uncharacterized protein (TIGR03067 family)
MHGEPHVGKKLPSRPNLDHLRRQAKSLLAALASGEADALATIREHLPAAKGMSDRQIRQAPFRLADAQSAVARKTGFASWPQLGRHVEQLRALEGTWSFEYLEIDGAEMPAGMFAGSRLLIDGDCFRTESPEANYEGVFNIDVEAQPHAIDIDFIAGPEAGNRNMGIFRLDGDRLEFCLDMNGKTRPMEFRSTGGDGRAYERLSRASGVRPENVTGGTPPAEKPEVVAQACVGFEFTDSPLLARLQGEWSAVKIIRDGQELPPAMLATGRRTAARNEVTIRFGGQVMIRALVRFNESADLLQIDYYNLHGSLKGTIQHGIMKWIGSDACFNMAAPCQPRPDEFTAPLGSGRTLSQWRLKK